MTLLRVGLSLCVLIISAPATGLEKSCGHSLLTRGVVLSINTWSTGAHYIDRAAARGLRPLLVLSEPVPQWAAESHARALAAAGNKQLVVPSDTVDPAEWLAQKMVDIAPDIRKIEAGSESPGVPLSQELAVKLGMPGLTEPAAIRAMTNKLDLSRFLAKARLPHLPFHAVNSKAELLSVAASIRFPSVIKPDNANGSIGVRVVNNVSDLLKAYDTIVHAPRDGRVSKSGAIIQPFVYDESRPYEFVVNAYGGKVTGIWEYRKRLAPVEGAMQVPMYDVSVLLSPEDPRVQRALLPSFRDFHAVFGGYQGAIHLESFLMEDDSVLPVDAGFRFAGGHMAQAEFFATDNSQVEMALLSALDFKAFRASSNMYQLKRGVAVLDVATGFRSGDAGTFTLGRWAEFQKLLQAVGGEVVDFEFNYKEGQAFRPVIDLDSSIGTLVVGAQNPSDIEVVIASAKHWIASGGLLK